MLRDASPGISFIVPAFNEEQTIRSTLDRLVKVLGEMEMQTEIIVVDDGSSDNTAHIAREVDNVSIVSHPINTGYGSALKSGIVSAQYEYIGIVDADGTYPIERLPELVSEMQRGFDMAVAERSNLREIDGLKKRFFRTVLLEFINIFISAKIKDPNSGFRVFNRRFALLFFPFLCDTFSFTTSLTLFALGSGHFVSYVPMDYGRREGKSKVRHFRDSLRMAQLILQGITFFNPIKLYILVAIALIIFVGIPSIILSIYDLQGPSIIYGMIGCSSALLLGLGVLADVMRISSMGPTALDQDLAPRSIRREKK